MSILVTGGSGFLGTRLVRKLEKSGKVIIFSKSLEEQEKPGGGESLFDFSGTMMVYGDIKKIEDLEEAFRKKVDIVYHLAANLDESSPDMWNDNVLGTRNVVGLCKKHNVKRLIHMSSCGVTGYGKISTEDSSYNPNTEYEKSKAEAEKIVIESGLDYTIIRAPIIIGPNTIWLKILKAAKKGYPIIGSGSNKFHLAYIDDVVDILFLARNRRSSIKEIFNVATIDCFTYEETYEMMAKELGEPAKKRRVPAFLMKAVASVNGAFCKLTGKKPSLTLMKSSIERLIVNREVSIEKARDILGFEPKYDTRKAVRSTVEGLRKSGMI